MTTIPKPKWGLLYAVIPLAVAVLAGAEIAASTIAGGRRLLEFGAGLVILGLLTVWVRCNSIALREADSCDETRPKAHARVLYPRPMGSAAQRSSREKILWAFRFPPITPKERGRLRGP